MTVTVAWVEGEHRLVGDWSGIEQGNAFLQHLRSRAFAPATIRAYAFDLTNFARFLTEQQLELGAVEPVDVFGWVDWQGVRVTGSGSRVARFARSGAAPATVNRRVAGDQPGPCASTWPGAAAHSSGRAGAPGPRAGSLRRAAGP